MIALVAGCAYCGQPLDLVTVEDGESWGPAVLWGYLAERRHAGECGSRPVDARTEVDQ